MLGARREGRLVKRPYPVLYGRRRGAASAHIRACPSLFPCQPMQQDSIKERGREEERDKRGDVNMMSLHSLSDLWCPSSPFHTQPYRIIACLRLNV